MTTFRPVLVERRKKTVVRILMNFEEKGSRRDSPYVHSVLDKEIVVLGQVRRDCLGLETSPSLVKVVRRHLQAGKIKAAVSRVRDCAEEEGKHRSILFEQITMMLEKGRTKARVDTSSIITRPGPADGGGGNEMDVREPVFLEDFGLDESRKT